MGSGDFFKFESTFQQCQFFGGFFNVEEQGLF